MGKNCKNFKFSEKNAKISKFLKNLQKFQGFGKFFVASDLIEINIKNLEIENNLNFDF